MTGMRIALVITLLTLVGPGLAVAGDDAEEPNIEFFYPLVTRRPVIERELELAGRHEARNDGRTSEIEAGIEVPLLPRWQLEVEMPLVLQAPDEGAFTAGVGDVTLDTKVQVFKSVERRALVATGLEVRFPTGSKRRGLGGETSVEPYLTAATAFGPVDMIASFAWELDASAHVHGRREQEITGGLAAGYRLTRTVVPLVEVVTVNQIQGRERSDEGGEPSLVGETRVSIVPGVNWRVTPASTARLGIELPLTGPRTFDYVVHAGVVWEF